MRDTGLLTEDEHAVMDLTARLANALGRVVGNHWPTRQATA